MDEGRPRARAMAVRGEELVYVGDDSSEALRAAGTGADIRDGEAGTIVPGFNDNHLHAVAMGDHELSPDLSGLDSGEIVALLRERFPEPERGEVLRAFNWDYPACPRPRKELLDAAFPRNPVVLSQYSGHGHWLNSAALRMLRIDAHHGPKEGAVLRDPDGEPTGIVRDLGDTRLSRRHYRDIFFDSAQRERRLDIALASFAAHGITSVQDNTWFHPELLGLARRYDRGELSCRFSCWPLGRIAWARLALDAAFALGAGRGDWIHPGPVKFFVDGTFSTRNACLSEPFLGEDGEADDECPIPPSPLEQLFFLGRTGRQGAFHIIGDKGITLFLDAFEKARARYPKLIDQRIRIEHAQLVRREDLARIRELGVVVCAQPTALGSPEKDVALLGRERALAAYPYRSLIDSSVHLSFGSDVPGESSFDPIAAIHMAANREGPERISAEEALRCYTLGSAYAEFAEDRKGALKAGMLADFVRLSQDMTTASRETLRDTIILETVVGGKSVYRREGATFTRTL